MATHINAKQLWHVELGSSDVVFPLRDYLRRIGLTAEVRGPTFIEIESDVAEDELESHVATWASVTGVPATLKARTSPQAMLVPPPPPAEPPRLGSLLVRKGMISEDQLAVALTEARASNDLVGRVLLRNQWIFEDELARVLSEQLDIPYLSIMRIGVNVEVVQLLPADVGMDVAAIPVRRRGDAIHVAFADPTDQRALESVQEHLPMIDVAVAELSDIMAAWRQVAPRR